MTTPDELRDVLRRMPTGVAVLTVDANGQRVGPVTVATLVSLSLEPPLVGVAIARQAAIHELLREAGDVRILTPRRRSTGRWPSTSRAGYRRSRCGRGSRPATAASGAPLLEGALGWLQCSVVDEIATGSHTFFVCKVDYAEPGTGGAPLIRLDGVYH